MHVWPKQLFEMFELFFKHVSVWESNGLQSIKIGLDFDLSTRLANEIAPLVTLVIVILCATHTVLYYVTGCTAHK